MSPQYIGAQTCEQYSIKGRTSAQYAGRKVAGVKLLYHEQDLSRPRPHSSRLLTKL